MNTVLIYLHLAVILIISGQMLDEDAPILMRAYGAFSAIVTAVFAYCYAVWSIWQVVMQ